MKTNKPDYFLETSAAVIGENAEKLVRIESNPDEITLKFTTSSLPEKELYSIQLSPEDCIRMVDMLCAIHKHHTGS